jgi:hypothetical protein
MEPFARLSFDNANGPHARHLARQSGAIDHVDHVESPFPSTTVSAQLYSCS